MFELLPGYNETPMTELAMELPMFHWGSAYTPDWNGDGVLDLFHPNHFSFSKLDDRWSDPSTSKVGPSRGGCLTDWDAVLRNGTDGTYYAANGGGGFIERNDEEPSTCFDAHSSAFIDIDGDGIKDLYLVTGGGRGVGNSSDFDNALFWGEADATSDLGYRLVGGRDAALQAELHGRNIYGNQRGRHQYWFDADGDGLLDVVTLNDERKDDNVSPGRFYKNMNGRKFEPKKIAGSRFAEYASAAVLTDLDGDGFAKELVVPSSCKDGSSHFVCKWRPRNSLTVYQFHPGKGEIRRQTLTLKPPPGLSQFDLRWGSYDIATEDFDLDGHPDVAILWSTRVDFYLWSKRQASCNRILDDQARKKCLLRMGFPHRNLQLNPLCGSKGARGFRFADFNLDGRIDMLVICRTPGRHGIYELVSSNTWRLMENPSAGGATDYGDLNSMTYMLGPKDICEGVPTTSDASVRKKNRCTLWIEQTECWKLQYLMLFAICSLHKQNRVEAVSPTVSDIDNDGFADIILGHRFGAVVILRNTLGGSGNNNRFLAVDVDKKAGPAASVGAIVKLTASNMGRLASETTTQLRVVSTLGHGTDSEGGSEDRIIFGLGTAGEPTELQVQWPHCCEPTFINGTELASWVNSMDSPYEVPAPPENCDKSCFS